MNFFPPAVAPGMSIDKDLQAMATAQNFAAIATISADGTPRNHMMWIDADDEHLVFNTETHRSKFADVERDPRITVTVIDKDNAYRYIEARGRVVETITGDEAMAHIDAVSNRYTGADYANPIQSERVIVKIKPEKIHKNGI